MAGYGTAMNDTVTVRRATADDWEAAAGLLAELGRPPVVGTDTADAHRVAFAGYLDRSDAVALVGEAGGEIVGFCDLEFRTRLNFLEREAWIPDLIVAEQARSGGVGAALLAEAERIAAERGCFSLTLESAAWRTRAHGFYRREAMPDVGLCFAKSLTGVVWPPPPPSFESPSP